jgi:hypothetical protein
MIRQGFLILAEKASAVGQYEKALDDQDAPANSL